MRWSVENRHQAGAFTSHYSECTCRYLSVYSGENCFGLIGISMNGRPFTDFENTILLSIVHECTMALENERMGEEQRKAEILAENERLRANLLRSLSHDLRTPLTSIYGNASNLLSYDKDLLPEEREKIYSDILEDSGWLNPQFENMLSMTRLESSSDLHKTVESMEDVIEESLRHISPHPDHKICFESSDQDLFAAMDPRLIMQVMVNLLNNAIKYTPAGSSVHVRMKQDSDMVCVEVADNGPGIPDEDKPHVFKLFYTGKHVLEDSYRSMGIGLNLCAMIIHAHGGEIEVSDNDRIPADGGADTPRGAVFRFTLPAQKIPLPE
jgi:two-component system sensor histidine kinase KdpD